MTDAVFRAYAKINLGLRILSKRPDGYHNIETIFHRLDVYDEISFRRSSDIRVVSSSPEVPGNEQNICFKAAQLLRESLGVTNGVTISIEKQIPVGAGLGGGSSDAATVVRELPSFWSRMADEETMQATALKLGSDVPYFLRRGSANARGRGELLEHFDLDIPYTILLCHPNIHVSTAWAYRNVTPRQDNPAPDLKTVLLRGMRTPALLQSELVNDFEPPVFKHHPEIQQVKEAMLEGGALFALMSGSGSSVYGFFNHAPSADEVVSQLRPRGYRMFLTPPLFKA